ncbi:MAG: acyl transferase domain-containing protein/7-keto-8-aminopelargonate synthetase-like enzyme [Myxococcota bacterium]|jgi:acyl transferase domain-containing protein/7-keto-8-aminopelargonate synthetase-like enzyme/NAD(P)-dependent dehydrogenase (short-subunit alcohol dehydrogenase family)
MKPGAVAIVGIGCRFSGAHDLQQFWRMTLAGEDGFSPVPADRWDQAAFFDESRRTRDKSYAPRGGFLDDVRSFPAIALQVPPRRVEVMDPQQRLSLECAFQAVDDAGMTPGELPHKTGVYMGVTATQYKTLSGARVIAQLMASGELGQAPEDPSVIARAVERVLPARPFTAPGLLSNMIAATVAQELRVHGPAYTTDAACASGLVAISNAVDALRAGSIDCALAGGVFISLTPEHHIAFSRIGAISQQGACLPFDARADGFVEGDGGGILVLKRYEDAIRDDDRIYAVVHGIGINNDGGGTGPMAPVKSGQVEVVQNAWEDAKKHGADPKYLGYIEAHGTGTTVGDKIEFDGLTEAIGAEVVRAGLGSSKANFGHTMSAAGVCGLIRATLALHHKTIPPMAHFQSAKEDLKAELERDGAAFFIPTEPEAWAGEFRHATVSSFGFGGTNVHMVVGASGVPTPAVVEQAELVRLSAPTTEALRDLAKRTATAIEADATSTVAGVARSWSKRRQQAARVAVVATSRTELIERLAAFGSGDYPDGIVLNTVDMDADAPKVAFMFPGQGAQRLGMIAGIRDRFPVVAETLATLDAASTEVVGRPIGEFLYPERRATTVDTETANAELTNTQHCQPALFAVGTALDKLLRQVGVEPTVCVGHSVGEFTAAAAAGVTSIEDGIRWVARRGAAMSKMSGDRGAMAAIVAPRDEVEALLVPGVVLANLNHPRQMVVSGPTDAVAKVVGAALAKELKAVPLSVSHGFHSPVFETLDLSAVIDGIVLSDPTTSMASCIQDHCYANADEARQVYKDHATSPVIWTKAIAQCREAGATLFLQVGAGGPLVSFAKGILRGPQHEGVQALSLASKDDEDGGASLLLTLGQLWTLGVDLDLDGVTAAAPVASVPPVVLPREDYWVVKDAPTTKMQLVAGSSAPRVAAKTASVVAAAAPSTSGVADIVIGAVARASAYPVEALRPGMKLGDDLGFDSMMVADLAEDLGKAIAGFQGIPQEILINSPTIQDIIDFAENPTVAGDGTSEADDEAPLSRWGIRWVETALPTDTVGGWATRTLTAGTFLAVGDGTRELSDALTDLGWTQTADGAADLVIYGARRDTPTPLNAVLSGEHAAPDYAADFVAVLDAQASATKTPDVLVLRRDDDPWAEALSGAARCVAREWPDAVVKTIRGDVDAATLLAELRSADQTTDVRYDVGSEGPVRHVLGTLPFDDIQTNASYVVGDNDVVLVTGGTRGIGRALGLRLAKTGATVLLMGRSIPVDAPQTDGVAYLNADVTDADAVSSALAGRAVTVLIHAAGVLADGPLGSVDAARGQLVRDVKVLGFINAVRACGTSLKVAQGIGSWAGRFGNASQIHYGAANALLSELSWRLPSRIRGVVSEFGPWRDSEMVQSIPATVRQAMRSQGIDFVTDEVGLDALIEDLTSGTKSIVRGRNVPATTRRTIRTETLSAATHPYLLDHAIDGVPVLPLAGAATLIAETAGLSTPFAVADLTLYKGIAVREPLSVKVIVNGERAEIRQGESNALSYRAKVRRLDWDAPSPDISPKTQPGGDAPTLSLADFYADVTFHGPLLQGITSIDAVGANFIRGTLRTTEPGAWIPGTTQSAWAIDPLALDSAMQLTAYIAWTRYQRAGTPVGFERMTQLKPWPKHSEITAEAVFADRPDEDDDRFEATLTFWDTDGDVIAVADKVVAQMPRVEAASDTTTVTETATVAEEAPFEIKPEWIDAAQWRGYKDIAFRLVAVEAMGVKNPFFDLHQGTARNTTLIDDHEVINYSSYNYLGLSGDPRIIENVYEGMKRYGTSVSASRIASGERPFHRELEAELAKAQGVDDAVVMAGGHATNINTIGHVFNPGDLILHDELIHDSCLQGIKLSGAARRSFRHEDIDHLESQLKELRRHYEKVLILVEGVYSMDGDICNLPELIRVKKQHGCMLMVDEAHSFGCVGPTGFGVGEHFKALGHDIDTRDVDIWMGTMSKSLSAMGGWIAGKKEFITYLRYTTPGFVFAAGIPATLGVAALSAIRLWQGEDKWRVTKLQANSKRFYELLKERGQDTGPSTGESPVIPVITGDSMHAMQLSEKLLDVHGINAKPIIFPAVANDAARLRFFMTALHTEEQLVYTADKIAESLAEIRGK